MSFKFSLYLRMPLLLVKIVYQETKACLNINKNKKKNNNLRVRDLEKNIFELGI